MALLTFAGIPAAQHADAHPKHPGQQPPNIVLIHLDDMGYGDLTATGPPDTGRPTSTGSAPKACASPIITAPRLSAALRAPGF